MWRRILLGLTLLGVCASLAFGQGRIANIFNNYDLDVNAYIYCDTTAIPTFMATCATGVAADDGWLDVRDHRDKVVGVVLDAIALVGGVDVTFEVRYQKTRGNYTSAITLMTLINKTVVGTDNQSVRIPDEVTQFRVGIRIGTNDDGDAVDEDIDIIYNAR